MSHFMPAQQESSARVGVCLPCDLAGALDALVGAQSCNCPQAIAFLMRIGAVMSARMHASDAEKNPGQWTTQDWEAHMREEEELLFPVLPSCVAAQLTQEHQRFRSEMNIYGVIKSDTLLESHFKAEEEWTEYLMSYVPQSDDGGSVSVSGAAEDVKAGRDAGQFVAIVAIAFGLVFLGMRAMR